MAIAAIYMILVAGLSFLALGFWKEDKWLIILSSFIFIPLGLKIINEGFEDIVSFQWKWIFGLIFIFMGVYFGSRASLEIMNDHQE